MLVPGFQSYRLAKWNIHSCSDDTNFFQFVKIKFDCFLTGNQSALATIPTCHDARHGCGAAIPLLILGDRLQLRARQSGGCLQPRPEAEVQRGRNLHASGRSRDRNILKTFFPSYASEVTQDGFFMFKKWPKFCSRRFNSASDDRLMTCYPLFLSLQCTYLAIVWYYLREHSLFNLDQISGNEVSLETCWKI